jgi:hypothetical protein
MNSVFRIEIDDSRRPAVAYGEKCLPGTIWISGHSESIQMPVDFWSVADYKRQWREGIGRILADTVTSCLVTGMRDPEQGVLIDVWPLYTDPDHAGVVVIQSRTLLCSKIRMQFTGLNFHDLIGPREFMTPDGDPIPEWVVPCGSLADFLKELS